MSSDNLYLFDGSSSSLYQTSSPEDFVSETDFVLFDHEFSSLSDLQTNPLTHQTPTSNFPNGFGDSHVLSNSFTVKTEESAFRSDIGSQNLVFGYNHSYFNTNSNSVENVAKSFHRSFSVNSFEQKPRSEFSFSNSFDASIESPSFHNQALSLSENGFLRRVCSTGDLQSFERVRRTTQRSLSSPLRSESSLVEESNFKVGKYSAEERKERISKYRAKRTLRNFNKTIKYACRKTLADNRPRIRGRFARNDEPGGFDVPKATSSSSSRLDVDDDDDIWLEGLHEEEEGFDQTVKGQFVNNYNIGPTQFHYYGF